MRVSITAVLTGPVNLTVRYTRGVLCSPIMREPTVYPAHSTQLLKSAREVSQ